MFLYSIIPLAIVAYSVNVGILFAHTSDRLFPIWYLSEETLASLDLDDGSVEDWVDEVGEPTLTPLDFNLLSGYDFISYDQHDPANLDFRIWVGWSDGGRIHVAGQFADDMYINEYDPLLSPNNRFDVHDSMGILVDGDHTGGPFFFSPSHGEIEKALKTNRQAQFYLTIARGPDGPMVSLPSTTVYALGFEELDEPVEWMVHPPLARGGGGVFGENPTIWVTEFFVTCFDRLHHLNPEESEVSLLAEGKIIGFDVFVFDYDDNPVGPHALYWLREPEEVEEIAEGADFFVDGLLLGPGGEPGDTAVQSVSWGRIKASLGIDLRSENDRPGKD